MLMVVLTVRWNSDCIPLRRDTPVRARAGGAYLRRLLLRLDPSMTATETDPRSAPFRDVLISFMVLSFLPRYLCVAIGGCACSCSRVLVALGFIPACPGNMAAGSRALPRQSAPRKIVGERFTQGPEVEVAWGLFMARPSECALCPHVASVSAASRPIHE
jgi:hypothetical protein